VVRVSDRLAMEAVFAFTPVGWGFPALAPVNNGKYLFPEHVRASNQESP
jgi:hypothetical protein